MRIYPKQNRSGKGVTMPRIPVLPSKVETYATDDRDAIVMLEYSWGTAGARANLGAAEPLPTSSTNHIV